MVVYKLNRKLQIKLNSDDKDLKTLSQSLQKVKEGRIGFLFVNGSSVLSVKSSL